MDNTSRELRLVPTHSRSHRTHHDDYPLVGHHPVSTLRLWYNKDDSCRNHQEVTKVDTIYLNTFRFDSTYVSHNLLTDRSHDTILIKETNTEIRYKILRDTVERVKIEIQRDSIPYEVRITETIEVTKPPTLFDKLCKACFFLLLGSILFLIIRFVKNFL